MGSCAHPTQQLTLRTHLLLHVVGRRPELWLDAPEEGVDVVDVAALSEVVVPVWRVDVWQRRRAHRALLRLGLHLLPHLRLRWGLLLLLLLLLLLRWGLVGVPARLWRHRG
jgi:hypothetical protein